MNDTLTTYAAVAFLMHLDCLDAEIKIAETQAETAKSQRDCLIYQGLAVMYRNHAQPTTVPTKIVNALALAADYLEA